MKQRAGRRRRSSAARLRPFWFLAAVALAVATVSAFWLAEWPALRPHSIAVEGNRVVSTAEILHAARIRRDENIWLQNTSAMADRIAAIPYIANVQVRRIPPARVVIVVSEREPYAVVAGANGRVLVDRSLRVLQRSDASFRALPVLALGTVTIPANGDVLQASSAVGLRDALELLTRAHVGVGQLSYDRFGDVIARLRSGVRVLFGDPTQLAQGIALVNPILSQVGRGPRPIVQLDLRAPRTPVVTYKSAATNPR